MMDVRNLPKLCSTMIRMCRSLVFLLAVTTPLTWAGPIPFQQQQISINPKNQHVAEFLQDLFSRSGLRVAVSRNVFGSVSGLQEGTSEAVFHKILHDYGLMAFYDGTTVHIYTPAETTNRIFPMYAGGAAAVIATARNMQLTDDFNTLNMNQSGGVIASGNSHFVKMIGDLVASQQNQATFSGPMGFKVYYLRYAWAHDVVAQSGSKTTVVPGVASILRALLTTQRSNGPSPALTQYMGTGEQSLRSQGQSRRDQGTLGALGANPLLASAGTVQQAWDARSAGDAPLQDSIALAAIDGARIEADMRLNAIIVRDQPERLPYYDQLIQALDVEPQALEIEATIIDLNTDRLREMGINWSLTDHRYALLFGDNTGRNGSAGGVMSLVLGGRDNFMARISAMQQQEAARIVSSPQIMTLSNVEALLDSTETFYVSVAGRDEVDLFKVSAGTTLRVTPHVFREGDEIRIKLLVQIEDGAIEPATVGGIPRVSRSSINTQALIGAGESLLIGGLVKVTSGEGVTKVPFLGDIPVLGNLFKVRTDKNKHQERLFLISPRLIPARRPIHVAAPIGPQRPGHAIAIPPMLNPEAQPDAPLEPEPSPEQDTVEVKPLLQVQNDGNTAPFGEF